MANFINKINIKKVRHLENIEIDLGNEKKHLILTGKNGSGKTSVLEELDKYFMDDILNPYEIKTSSYYENTFDNCYPILKNREINKNNFIYSYFKVGRNNITNKPKGINKVNLSKNRTEKLNKDFLQYIVNLKAEKSFANDDNDTKTVKNIDDWFENFENILKQIFNDDSLRLVFDRKNYNFKIHKDSREPFDFNTLSSGYSAIIDIITELILKIENTESKSFDCEGIVLIDEIETHLHV